MEAIEIVRLSWSDFFATLLGLAMLYAVLGFSMRIFQRFSFLGRLQSGVKDLLRITQLIFEPIAILILVGVFVLINPPWHLLLLALVLLLGFYPIKNYVCGRIVLFDTNIARGNQMQIESSTGSIEEIGRLGLKLRTGLGLQFVNYVKILTKGYAMISGEKISGLYEVEFMAIDADEPKMNTEQLLDRLATTPYLNQGQDLQIHVDPDNHSRMQARLMVRERDHMEDLFALTQEWGYKCRVLEK